MRGESRRVFEIIVGACLGMLGLVVRFGESLCVDTDLVATDSRGGHCDNGNYDSRNICGLYDDFDFTASQMCCGCGGGFTWDKGSLDEEWDASAPYCYDDTGNGQLDSDGSACGLFHVFDESFCALADDSDFTASEMCCACGGGDTRICESLSRLRCALLVVGEILSVSGTKHLSRHTRIFKALKIVLTS